MDGGCDPSHRGSRGPQVECCPLLPVMAAEYICNCVFVRVCVFRDVSSVELLMNNHQGIKAEIDARNDSFTSCIELGKALLARKHYAAEEVRRVHLFLLLISKSFHSLTGGDYSPITGTVFVLLVQIKEKLLQLTDKRKEMIDKWEDRWEWLRLSKICSQPVSIWDLFQPVSICQTGNS